MVSIHPVDLDRGTRLGASLVLFLLLLTACDGVNMGEAIGTDKLAEEGGAVSGGSSPRDADMESVGPEGAFRVFYQFIDDRGQVQFVEKLTDVPEAWRDRVGYVEMSQAPPLSPAEARKSWELSAKRAREVELAARSARTVPAKAGSRRMDDFKDSEGEVVLYSATWCGYCTQAKRHLDRDGVDYEVRDVDNPHIAKELREKTGRGGVPVLDFGGEILRGYSAGQYDRAIEKISG